MGLSFSVLASAHAARVNAILKKRKRAQPIPVERKDKLGWVYPGNAPVKSDKNKHLGNVHESGADALDNEPTDKHER